MTNYQYCRPKKVKNLQEATLHFEEKAELSVLEVDNATILPLKPCAGLLFGRGGVIDEQGQYVQLSAIEGRVEGAYPVQESTFEDQRVVYCGYLVNHWGHFLIEGVARLWYYLTHPQNVDRYIFVTDVGGGKQTQKPIIRLSLNC